jgi:peptidoglycan/LPS O-acetylase OafA/YrhL
VDAHLQSDVSMPRVVDEGEYRADVDGLRAVAVLSVILFHLDKQLLPGGFVGVDIFFVISGFLITRNIVVGIHRCRFSLVEFYRRRIKRIAPAMLVVVAVTTLFAQLLLVPEDAREALKSAVASVLSLANVFFWLHTDTSYFAANTAELPLLHLWSLGVEEQFYMIWPVLLLVFYRRGRTVVFMLGLVVAGVISLAIADALYADHPAFVYYMLPTRAGELMAGALVALLVVERFGQFVPNVLFGWLAALGTLLLIASLTLLNSESRFPGWLAAAPAIGAGLLIFAGHYQSTIPSRILCWRPLVLIGLISYSAYLWHWPLLAFYRYAYQDVTLLAGSLIFVTTLSLAAITYRWVELPARRSTSGASRIIVQQYLLPGGAIVGAALITIYPAKFGIATMYSPAYLKKLEEVRATSRPAYLDDSVCQRQQVVTADTRNEHCVLGDSAAGFPKAVLWGDSNAAHYVGMLDQIARRAGFRFRNIEIGSCPPVVGDPKPYISSVRRLECESSLDIVRPVVGRFPVIIVSASWTSYQERSAEFLTSFLSEVRALADSGKLVIILGKVLPVRGYDPRCREKALRFPWLLCANPVVDPAAYVLDINEKLRRFAEQTANVRYFDANAYLCPRGRCAALGPDGVPRYYDESHLTMAASSRLGVEILAREGVPQPFRLVAGWPDTSN